MAHYAFLNEDNIVTEVIVGRDETDTEALPEGFADWEEFYLSRRPNAVSCKRTSYNTIKGQHINEGTPFRGQYAGVGSTYDPDTDKFIPFKYNEDLVWNEEIYDWEFPS